VFLIDFIVFLLYASVTNFNMGHYMPSAASLLNSPSGESSIVLFNQDRDLIPFQNMAVRGGILLLEAEVESSLSNRVKHIIEVVLAWITDGKWCGDSRVEQFNDHIKFFARLLKSDIDINSLDQMRSICEKLQFVYDQVHALRSKQRIITTGEELALLASKISELKKIVSSNEQPTILTNEPLPAFTVERKPSITYVQTPLLIEEHSLALELDSPLNSCVDTPKLPVAADQLLISTTTPDESPVLVQSTPKQDARGTAKAKESHSDKGPAGSAVPQKTKTETAKPAPMHEFAPFDENDWEIDEAFLNDDDSDDDSEELARSTTYRVDESEDEAPIPNLITSGSRVFKPEDISQPIPQKVEPLAIGAFAWTEASSEHGGSAISGRKVQPLFITAANAIDVPSAQVAESIPVDEPPVSSNAASKGESTSMDGEVKEVDSRDRTVEVESDQEDYDKKQNIMIFFREYLSEHEIRFFDEEHFQLWQLSKKRSLEKEMEQLKLPKYRYKEFAFTDWHEQYILEFNITYEAGDFDKWIISFYEWIMAQKRFSDLVIQLSEIKRYASELMGIAFEMRKPLEAIQEEEPIFSKETVFRADPSGYGSDLDVEDHGAYRGSSDSKKPRLFLEGAPISQSSPDLYGDAPPFSVGQSTTAGTRWTNRVGLMSRPTRASQLQPPAHQPQLLRIEPPRS